MPQYKVLRPLHTAKGSFAPSVKDGRIVYPVIELSDVDAKLALARGAVEVSDERLAAEAPVADPRDRLLSQAEFVQQQRVAFEKELPLMYRDYETDWRRRRMRAADLAGLTDDAPPATPENTGRAPRNDAPPPPPPARSDAPPPPPPPAQQPAAGPEKKAAGGKS